MQLQYITEHNKQNQDLRLAIDRSCLIYIMEYNRMLNRAPVPEDAQVEYLVVGNQEQLNRLQRELQTAVKVRQTVSQLPEPFYRRALRGDKAQDAVGLAGAPAEPKSAQATPETEADAAETLGDVAEEQRTHELAGESGGDHQADLLRRKLPERNDDR